MIKRFLLLILAGIFLAQVFAIMSELWWGFELFSHYLAYYLLAGLILLPLLFLARIPWASIPLTLLIAIQLAQIAPYYSTPTNTDLTTDFKIFSNNFFVPNDNFEELQSIISAENPDIFVIEEAAFAWNTEKEAYRETYPYLTMTEEVGPFGIVMGSKYPTIYEHITLGDYPVIDAQAKIGDETIRIIVIHTNHPLSSELMKQRNKVFEELALLVQESTLATLVIGDFNSTMWSPYFQKLIEDSELQDSRLGFGILTTWNENFWPLKIPIDHILTTSDIQIVDLHTGTNAGSDHLPIIAELSL